MKQLLVAQQGVCLGGRQRCMQGVHWEGRGGARRLSVHLVGSSSLVWALHGHSVVGHSSGPRASS